MATDHIRYDLLAQEALRGVMRQVLADVARNGVPGEHHFYVTFDTRAPGVKLSPRLRAQYPEEMRIVLQHQFWDLTVGDEGFEVGLSFGGVAERLSVPFMAVTGFVDPSVQFGLQFATVVEDETADRAAPGKDAAAKGRPAEAATPPSAANTSGATTPKKAVPVPAPVPASRSEDEPDPPAGGGEVVRLDRFRKK